MNIKISLKGTEHNFDKWGDLNDRESKYICTNCGLEGIKQRGEDYIVVNKNRSNSKLIDNCKLQKKMIKKNMFLKCEFTDKEIEDFGKKLAKLHQEMELLEDEKKAAMSEMKAKMDAIEEEMRKYSRNINRGSEEREIECLIDFNHPKENEKTIIRQDTGEIVGILPMDDADYTLNFEKE